MGGLLATAGCQQFFFYYTLVTWNSEKCFKRRKSVQFIRQFHQKHVNADSFGEAFLEKYLQSIIYTCIYTSNMFFCNGWKTDYTDKAAGDNFISLSVSGLP